MAKEHTQAGWEENPSSTKDKGSGSDFDSTPSLIYTNKDLDVKDVFIVTDQQVNMLGIGVSFSRKGVSGAIYSAAMNDYIIGVTRLSLAPKIGLPRPKIAGFGKTFIVKDEVGGATTTAITVVSQGEETIDGGANKTIAANYGSLRLYTDGANWFTF